MRILQFSNKRGIYSLFKGHGKKAYIFFSDAYGVIGFADVVENNINDITVNIFLCNGSKIWSWSVNSIIKQGIKKFETIYTKDKKIEFNINYVDNFIDSTPNYSSGVFDFNCNIEIKKDCKLVK